MKNDKDKFTENSRKKDRKYVAKLEAKDEVKICPNMKTNGHYSSGMNPCNSTEKKNIIT